MKVSKVLIEQDEIEQKVKELAERINKDYLGEELVIVGILKGAFIVISDLAKQLDVDVTFEFMSIQSYEGTKSTGQIKIDKDLDIDITGKNILIVEDIFDTGLTLSHLKNLLESRNPKSIEILCMFIKLAYLKFANYSRVQFQQFHNISHHHVESFAQQNSVICFPS